MMNLTRGNWSFRQHNIDTLAKFYTRERRECWLFSASPRIPYGGEESPLGEDHVQSRLLHPERRIEDEARCVVPMAIWLLAGLLLQLQHHINIQSSVKQDQTFDFTELRRPSLLTVALRPSLEVELLLFLVAEKTPTAEMEFAGEDPCSVLVAASEREDRRRSSLVLFLCQSAASRLVHYHVYRKTSTYELKVLSLDNTADEPLLSQIDRSSIE
nr:hypothetical protein Iba_chr09cCG7830 [Ipomoea batatas]